MRNEIEQGKTGGIPDAAHTPCCTTLPDQRVKANLVSPKPNKKKKKIPL